MSRLDSTRFEVSILGRSLVTPLGAEVPAVWDAVRRGQSPEVEFLDYAGWRFPVRSARVELSPALARHPRLRRASPISQFAVAAAEACLQDAGLVGSENGEALDAAVDGLVFAASNGSVAYTRKFFEGVDREGAGEGSPLLFPETVYNAPASHVCAALGLTGPSLSLVGDAAVGLSALRMALQMLVTGSCRRVLVVAAEELDPVALAGYAAWNVARPWRMEAQPSSAITPAFSGVVFAEGAGALLLGRTESEPLPSLGRLRLGESKSFATIREASRHLAASVDNLLAEEPAPDFVFSSVAGGWSGTFEDRALARSSGLPRGDSRPQVAVKKILGDALAASTLWQVILALQALQTAPGVDSGFASGAAPSALLSVLGYNGEIGAALVKK